MKITVASRGHPYTVTDEADPAAEFAALARDRRAAFLVDARVDDGHGATLFAGVPRERILRLEATEEAKSYERLGPVFLWLLESGFQRRGHLVVVGGGVVQDIGCFIASVLFRGVEWTLAPTTLLAQCDSCIGSKSSLNIAQFKNQLGTFYPPHRILLHPPFLATLAETEILSGLGEAIKLHLIDGEPALARLRAQLRHLPPNAETLREIVWASLAIKQRFIEEDEFDRGIRNLLNYGHTFAHAYETATHYAIPHGIAVSLGLVSAHYFSERLDLLPAGSTAALLSWLRPYLAGFEATLKQAPRDEIVQAMGRDKKNDGAEITFILTRGAGLMQKRTVSRRETLNFLTDLTALF